MNIAEDTKETNTSTPSLNAIVYESGQENEKTLIRHYRGYGDVEDKYGYFFIK